MFKFKEQVFTQDQLEQLSLKELVDLYNGNSEKPVNKFPDKTTALRRVISISETISEKPKRRVRQMYFQLPLNKEVKDVKDKNSLRYRIITLLRSGCTFDQVVQLVQDWDKERIENGSILKEDTLKNYRRRAYEGIRLVHYYVGYGLKQNSDGSINLVEPK